MRKTTRVGTGRRPQTPLGPLSEDELNAEERSVLHFWRQLTPEEQGHFGGWWRPWPAAARGRRSSCGYSKPCS